MEPDKIMKVLLELWSVGHVFSRTDSHRRSIFLNLRKNHIKKVEYLMTLVDSQVNELPWRIQI